LYGAGARARDTGPGRQRAGRADLLLRYARPVRAGAVPDDAERAAARELRGAALEVIKRIVLHPFIIATALGVASAAIHFEPPLALDRLMQFLQNAAAPCALFALGVTVALRPLRRMPWEVPVVLAVKLIIHPIMALLFLSL